MANRTEPQLATWLHIRGGKLGLPIGGNFELTARCNFDCPMCYVHLHEKDLEAAGKELTAGEWIQIAREAKDRGMMFALLTGGEPFVRKDFFEIYEAMRAMGLLISINSNGSMLRGSILERLLENPPLRMNISLYGGCRETYRQMCGQDVFETVTENIRALKEARVDIRLNLSMTPYNCRDIQKIYDISRELGVHIKASSYMYPPVRSANRADARFTAEDAAKLSVDWDAIRFTPEEFARRAEAANSLSATEERECSADLDEGVSCRAGYSTFWVTWDGRMLPCGMMPKPEAYPLREGFGEAWEYIKRETRKIRIPRECAACPKRKVCGVCAAVCVTETGSFDAVPEYMCRMTEETLRRIRQGQEERSKE
jgi:radical SAM protein with 4Fe4S-binding SPASM domain